MLIYVQKLDLENDLNLNECKFTLFKVLTKCWEYEDSL